NDGFRISEIIRDFKKFTAKAVMKIMNEIPESRKEWLMYRFEFAGKFDSRITKYKFWQETNHAVLLDNTKMIDQRINYVLKNPVRALIVSEPHEYLFSSARDYAGEKGYVNVHTGI
ncbi:MAG: transposase, partial [Draconibacterium sp.]